jgi:hypothetical protein
MIKTFVCDGTIVIPPGTLVEFCMAVSSNLVAGIPPCITLVDPFRFLAGPIKVPDATPPATPASSPLLIGIVVPRLCTGIIRINCFSTVVGGSAIGNIAILGYGMGTGDGEGGAGVRHVSGIPISCPAAEQFANIIISPFSMPEVRP